MVVAARPGLGTISHTLLTLEAARAAGLDVRAVVLTPWPAEPRAIERSNRATIAAEGDVPVAVLPEVELAPAALAAAGATAPRGRVAGPGPRRGGLGHDDLAPAGGDERDRAARRRARAPAGAGRSSACAATTRSTLRISNRAKAAPRQRRIPPPNGSHV